MFFFLLIIILSKIINTPKTPHTISNNSIHPLSWIWIKFKLNASYKNIIFDSYNHMIEKKKIWKKRQNGGRKPE